MKNRGLFEWLLRTSWQPGLLAVARAVPQVAGNTRRSRLRQNQPNVRSEPG